MSELPVKIDRQTARTAAMALAYLRAGFGIGAILFPKFVMRLWIGSDADSAGARLAGRALGGRDLALAVGPLLAMKHDVPVRGWVEGGMLSDACDSVATLLAFRKLPRRTRWLVLATCVGAAATGFVISSGVDSEPQPAD